MFFRSIGIVTFGSPRNKCKRRKILIVLLLMFGIFVGEDGTAEGTSCLSDFDESRQLAGNLKLVSRPQATDGILHYCDDHQLCTITCMNTNPNPFGVSSNFKLDDRCITLAKIKNMSDYVVLEEESVNTTIRFSCHLVGSVRCVIDDEHFSAMFGIAKDEEENCVSQTPPTTSAPPSSTPTVSSGSTGPTAPDGSTGKPNNPTDEKDYSGVIAAIVVIVAVILLVVMSTLTAALCYCYQYKKLCWRDLVQREEIEIQDDPEHGNLAILSVSNGSSRTNIPDSTAGDDVGAVSETTEDLTGEPMPDLDQDQVAEPIGGLQEQEVVSIFSQEREVLASPVEEEHLPLGIGRRNEVPDGRDEDSELGLFKPVQATD